MLDRYSYPLHFVQNTAFCERYAWLLVWRALASGLQSGMYLNAVETGLIFHKCKTRIIYWHCLESLESFAPLNFPHLFEVLNVKPYNGRVLWDFDSYPYFDQKVIARVPNVLKAVTDLRFRAPFKYTDPVKWKRHKKMPAFFYSRVESMFYRLPRIRRWVIRFTRWWWCSHEEAGRYKEHGRLLDSEYGD